jgi:hypothetical protein
MNAERRRAEKELQDILKITNPRTPDNKPEIVGELRDIIGRTNIMSSLSDWNDTVHILEHEKGPRPHFYLLTLDSEKRTLGIDPFAAEEAVTAQRAYDKAEKDTEHNPNVQLVLVSVDDVDALHKAYPNYYVDTKGFIAAVEREIGNGKSP